MEENYFFQRLKMLGQFIQIRNNTIYLSKVIWSSLETCAFKG